MRALFINRQMNESVGILENYVWGGYSISGSLKYESDNYKSLIQIIEEEEIDTLIAHKRDVNYVSRLLWECKKVKQYILTDTENSLPIETFNKRVQAKMWDIIAAKSTTENPIEQSGWVSSFTGDLFSEEEMKEWTDNTVNKLYPYCNMQSQVLEIGVASGLTCLRIAPLVKQYYGVDISKETLKITERALQLNGISNVQLGELEAIDVAQTGIRGIDVVIINSVAQYFPGYNYFIQVIKDVMRCMGERGIIFVGDILDLELKDSLKRALQDKGRKENNKNDLYFPRDFMYELSAYMTEVDKVEVTEKIGKFDNELNKYRYDVLLHIDKNKKTKQAHKKFQYAMLDKNFEIKKII